MVDDIKNLGNVARTNQNMSNSKISTENPVELSLYQAEISMEITYEKYLFATRNQEFHQRIEYY